MVKKYTSNKNYIKEPFESNSAHEVHTAISGWYGFFITIILILILSLAGSSDNIIEKWTGLLSAILIIVILYVSKKSPHLKSYITPLFFSVIAYIVWGGISTFYAASGKFAIFEFSKLLVALCIYLFVLLFTENNQAGFKNIAYIFSSIGCFFGILSVDAASFGLISKFFKIFIGIFTGAYNETGAFEQGIRITSIIGNPNTYSGFMALAVILSLYLSISARDKRNSTIGASLLAVNALSYLLAFSMGSLFMFLIACLIMIGITDRGKRTSLFLLMTETAVLTFIFAFISMLGLGKTGLISLIPILALFLNAFFLYHIDSRFRPSLNNKLDTNSKLPFIIVLVIIAFLIGYMALAFFISDDLKLDSNENVMRAIYIPGGQYTLAVESSAPVNISIESQNKYDLMRRTSTSIYNGTNEQPITFAVPDDSEIVKINLISTTERTEVTNASYTGSENGLIHLDYPLLPNIIANRLQNLFANENLIQRTIFFEDGMKLFSKSPVIGRGLGGFENGVYSVQEFYYETKYAHNHYLQVLSDLGIIGFMLFISMILFSTIAIINSKRKQRSLFAIPALAACAFQIFGQALVDAVWSTGIFLGFSAAVLALITVHCSEPIKIKNTSVINRIHFAEKSLLAVFAGLFILFLSGNLYAQIDAKGGVEDFDDIERLILFDRFEYNDYKVSYIVNAPRSNDTDVLTQADIYANELINVESNSLAPYVMAYYFEKYNDVNAFAAAKRGIENARSNPYMWSRIFDTFEEYLDPVGAHMDDAADRLKDPEYYVDGVLEFYDMLLDRNKDSLDNVMLSPYNQAFVGKLLEIRATHLYSIDWVFTAIMTYAFDSECAVDANQDGIPDSITVRSGNLSRNGEGYLTVADNTVIELNLYQKLGGQYTFMIRTETPQGITVTMDDKAQKVNYSEDEAYVTLILENNSEMKLSKFEITFPSAAVIDYITYTTELEQ